MPKPIPVTKLLDEIKDEIDRLHTIKRKDRRRLAARDLIEYIEPHHLSSY